MTVVLDDTVRAFVERIVGRPLRPAEQAIDILKLDMALNQAKDDLERAIRIEMRRATAAWIRADRNLAPQLRLTPAMEKPLRSLHQLGRKEAHLELERAGYTTARALATPETPNPDPRVGGLNEVVRTVRAGLPGVGRRIQDHFIGLDLGDLGMAAIARALLQIPGARDLASRVVSSALTSGLGDTFAATEALVGGWEYTAVLDGGTCEECAPLDGTTYETWDAIQEVLPGGGPNPACLGEGRCRCRAVPLPAP